MSITMTLEQGKPIGQSRLRYCAAARSSSGTPRKADASIGGSSRASPGMRHSVLRQPIGVVAAFSPWNFPMSSPARKVGGALSAGCSIILKASEETSAGAVQLVQAFDDAGLPPGVLNLVFGKPSDISEYLIPQPPVRLVTFRVRSGGQASLRDGGREHEARDHGTRRPCASDHVRRHRSV